MIVLDASVIVKALSPADEPDAEDARDVWTRVGLGQTRVLQPVHWLAEVGAVLARLSPDTAEEDVTDLSLLELPIRDDAEVMRRAARLAVDLDHPLFDTLYHAVALETPGATLVTADERYLQKAKGQGQIAALPDYVA